AVGFVIVIQGCGTMGGGTIALPVPVMPPGTQEIRPAQVDSLIAPPSETTTYVVGKGDSLSVIAKRFDLSVAELMALNGIRDKDKIRLGERLVLPGHQDVASALPPAPRRAPRRAPRLAAVPQGGGVYEVKRGDSLSVIASRHGTTVKELKELNGLSGDRILAEQKLVVPRASALAAPAPRRAVRAPGSAVRIPLASPEMSAPEGVGTDEDPTSASVIRPHTVEEGEELRMIAMMYDVSMKDLMILNKLSDTRLTPGQVLRIPMAD
ncbi:MAG: LysM peptidoglycan-binding domain-containing protein, partial [Lentisphaerae bacterium]|nr:LysM peptidoglycan-binding domain-containing protein [Lentisphaerota bacterium]